MGVLKFLFPLILLLMNNRSSDQESYCSLAKILLMNSELERLLEQAFVGLLSKF